MSIQTTISITRHDSESKIIQRLAQQLQDVGLMDDEELEDLLDEKFYNYSIIQP